MAAEKTFTYDDVSKHKTKGDLYVVIHDKVYDCASFIDEHPGGEEVLLDIAGQDATDAFEDVGHSDEAREILEKLVTGNLLRRPGDEKPLLQSSTSQPTPSQANGKGSIFYLLLVVAAIVLSGAYYLQNVPGLKIL